MKENNKAFAEVIESSLTSWLAQSWNWDFFPTFGSIVTIETKKRTLVGIVYQIKTGSIDPVRYPFTYQKTEEELMREQPQIFEFLKTTFSCLIIGYQENEKIFYQLAPEPPKIHAFVSPATPLLHRQFFSHNHYLHILFALSNNLFNLDELLLAVLKQLSDHQLLHQDALEQFVDTFSLLTGNDYRRLKLFLQRAQGLIF
ncbi:MAG: hypothetical protein BWY54_00462 [Candidatus Dependentiae bacterium ADurb.Bin331]|nr:MAG: hypothetical protein BWY54_00462 [Candidatus Dependentiae bacterium ADurb.Bin331]